MKIFLIIAVAVLAIGAGVYWHRESPAMTDLTLQGNVDIRQVDLAFNASGRIADMLAKEGDRVKAGQLLASIDTTRLQLALAQAGSQTNAQQEVLARLLAGSRPEEIRQAKAARDAARASLDDADAFFRRQENLADRHFVSRQQADSAKYARDRAMAQMKAAEETLRLAELGPRKEDIAAARATLASDRAQVGLMQRDLQDGELYAPSDGVIENRILEPGDMASPQKAVYTLALTAPVWVRVYLPEVYLGRVPAGVRAWIHTDSHPGKAYRGYVGYVSPSSEFTPKSVETTETRESLVYQARVFACEGGNVLRQGMPATVKIHLDQKAPAAGTDPCRG
jgi:HlyD family secretion protein